LIQVAISYFGAVLPLNAQGLPGRTWTALLAQMHTNPAEVQTGIALPYTGLHGLSHSAPVSNTPDSVRTVNVVADYWLAVERKLLGVKAGATWQCRRSDIAGRFAAQSTAGMAAPKIPGEGAE
jgi:hypothetical protein